MAIELRTFTGEDRDAVIWSVCLKMVEGVRTWGR